MKPKVGNIYFYVDNGKDMKGIDVTLIWVRIHYAMFHFIFENKHFQDTLMLSAPV